MFYSVILFKIHFNIIPQVKFPFMIYLLKFGVHFC